MKSEVEIKTEQIGEIPLIMHLQSKMGIGVIINEEIKGHGSRKGMSIGGMVMVWLSYILSERDHRMSEMEEWTRGQMSMLRALMPEDVEEKDFTDDRLADILKALSDDEDWEAIETSLGSRIMRVYQLNGGLVRLDSTAVALYHDEEGTSLFRHGVSKDHRPDLAQFKVMLATLDPLGMPLASLIVGGNEADDGLYLPAIKQTQKILGQGKQLYVGDSKMAALSTRAFLASSQDYYLCPLPQTGNNPKLLQEMVQMVKQKHPIEIIYAPITKAETKASVTALGYEMVRQQSDKIGGNRLSWQERVWALFSPSLAIQQRRGLQQRLLSAHSALSSLTEGKNSLKWTEECHLQAAAQTILKQYKVEGLLVLSYEKEVQSIHKRKYGDRGEETQQIINYHLKVARNNAAISQAHQLLGWKLYASNAPQTVLSFEQAVAAYRSSARIEHNFSRLKGRPLGLRPLYVHREDHAKGMCRLLSLALRLLTLTEFVVRQSLALANSTISGLYAGNPKRQTDLPTTERLLKAFRNITLSIIHLPNQFIAHITPLSELQIQILLLLGLSPAVYLDIASDIHPFSP